MEKGKVKSFLKKFLKIGFLLFIVFIIIVTYLIYHHIQTEKENKKNILTSKYVNISKLPLEGVVAEQNQDWDRALLIYKNSLSENPNQSDLWKRVAEINIHLQRYSTAVKALLEAIEFQRGDASLYAEAADLYVILKQPQDALYAINRAVEIDHANEKYRQRQIKIRKIFDESNTEELPESTFKKKEEGAKIIPKPLKPSKIPKIQKLLVPDIKISEPETESKPDVAKIITQSIVPNLETITKPASETIAVSKPETVLSEAALAQGPGPEAIKKAEDEDSEHKRAIDEGYAAEIKKQWLVALRIYLNEVKRKPDQPDIWRKVADVNYVLGRYPMAIAALKQALLYKPKDPDLYISLGDNYSANTQWHEASWAYRIALVQKPNEVDLLQKFAGVEYYLENYCEAIQALKKAIKIKPSSVLYIMLADNYVANHQWDEGMWLYKMLLSQKPNQPDLWRKIADIESEFKCYCHAIEALKKAIQYQPNNIEHYIALANAYSNNQEPKNAFCVIEQALIIEPCKTNLLFKKAEIAVQLKKYTMATRIYEFFAYSHNNEKEVLLGLIHLLIQLQKLDTAAKGYAYFLNVHPDEKEVWLEFANYQKTREHYFAAFNIMNNYYQRFGETEGYLKEKASLLALAGYPKESLCLVESLLLEKPDDYDLLYTQALAFNENKERRLALQSLECLVVKYPNKRKDTVYHWNLHTTQHVSDKITGYVESGFQHANLSQNYGRWDIQYLRGSLNTDSKNSWNWEIDHGWEYGQNAFYGVIENTHIINNEWYSTLGVGLSDNSIWVPKHYVGGALFKRFLNKKLVLYLGAHAYWWRPLPTTQDINPGFIYYFDRSFTIEGGAIVNRFNPKAICSTAYYVTLTQGKEKDHYFILRYGFGREAYAVVGNNILFPVETGFQSSSISLTWRQWVNKNWGFNLGGEIYKNVFYSRYIVKFGIFMDLSL